jgi:hypothetical protein
VYTVRKLWPYRTVHAEHDEHEEEEDGPELAARQRGHRLRVHLEHQARPCISSIGMSEGLDYIIFSIKICKSLEYKHESSELIFL